MSNRPNIPEHVRLQVWTEAAGRCQFRGCNKPLWYNELTLNKRNFGEMAHIIGASPKGPRGGKQSLELAQNPENIMLVCDRCHKEIDYRLLKNIYSIENLISMKKEHQERVRMLLDQPSKKTRPLFFSSKIGDQGNIFNERSILNAILPNHPDRISDDWFRIQLSDFDRTNKQEWAIAFKRIDQVLESVDRACKNSRISHLSVFGLAAQPLLMYLGRQLGDKITMQIFEPRRTDDQDKKWRWDDEDGNGVNYLVSKLNTSSSKDVILLLALSDYLQEDKYINMLSSNPNVYRITINNPVQGFLTRKSEKASFIQICRALLNQIQMEVGKDCIIHVFPAVPASLAIEFGRLLQPTKDPSIWIYENINNEKPEKIIKLI